MAVKLAAGICTYSDYLGLARCLDSLQAGEVDSIVIHGPFHAYTALDALSLTKTTEVCKAFLNTQLIDSAEPMPEIQKRQIYLDNAKNYDFLLVIDSDEYIAPNTKWQLFYNNLQWLIDDNTEFHIFDIMFDGPPYHAWPRPRLFYKPSEIRYDMLHFQWILPDTRLIRSQSDSRQTIQGIKIRHDISLRSKARNQARNQYRDWLAKREELAALAQSNDLR